MKVGTDATLLGAWARVPASCDGKPKILDIGTGTGILALMMAQRFPAAKVTAIDIDPGAAAQAADKPVSNPAPARPAVQKSSQPAPQKTKINKLQMVPTNSYKGGFN